MCAFLKNKLSIYIVDDHQIMIDGIKALLLSDDRFYVSGQNTSPLKALEEIEKNRPDILITDINMKELSGIELAKKIRRLFPDLKILALSMHDDRATISDMLEVGINGYVLKNTGMEELKSALLRISNGQLFFSEDVTAEMMKAISEPRNPLQKQNVSLTPREIEIVKLISMELNNAGIGEKLFISERTVETHRKNIFRKTNTKSVAGLIKLAIEQHII
ncbi:MAG: response regulator transcription factor [Bacteroidetes bacterium]|nr:response regulator transcription factor [Bacteroidota bacterium]